MPRQGSQTPVPHDQGHEHTSIVGARAMPVRYEPAAAPRPSTAMPAATRAGRRPPRRGTRLALTTATAVAALCGMVLGYRYSAGSHVGLEAITSPPAALPAHILVSSASRTIPTVGQTDPVTGAPVATGSDHAGSSSADQPLDPSAPVIVTVTHGVLHDASLIDATNGQSVPAALAPDQHSWHNTAPLAYARTYRLRVTAANDDHHLVQRVATVTTITPRQLVDATFVPGTGGDDVGVGQPLVVRFNHRVTDHAEAERALSVTSNPAQPGAWFWMSDTETHYRPATYWAPGTTVTLAANLFGAALGNGAFGRADQVDTVHIHDSWIARADGNDERMGIYHNGQLVKTMPISLGSPQHPSHNGPHVISSKAPSVVMDSCTYGVCRGDPGYYHETVYLDERISSDGEFVHSAPWSVRQQGDRNVSHGCINLSPDNAAWFYQHFGIGDVVEISHSGGPPLPVWDTYGDWELSWPQWQANTKAR